VVITDTPVSAWTVSAISQTPGSRPVGFGAPTRAASTTAPRSDPSPCGPSRPTSAELPSACRSSTTASRSRTRASCLSALAPGGIPDRAGEKVRGEDGSPVWRLGSKLFRCRRLSAAGRTEYTLSVMTSRNQLTHVDRDRASAKFWLQLVSLARNLGFSAHELRAIEKLIAQNSPGLLKTWNEYFEA